MHKRLLQQIARLELPDTPVIRALLGSVSEAYAEFDMERKRSDRSSMLMADELEELYDQQKALAKEMELQNLRFQAAQDNMRQGLCLFDNDGRLVVCNRRFLEIYQIPEGFELIGKTLSTILSECGAHGPAQDLGHRLLSLEHLSMRVNGASVLEQTWPDGRTISISRNTVSDGGYLDTSEDVTESRKATAQIAHMAKYDGLTDLPNRSLFNERLLDAVQHARRGELCAVLYLDLDRFKAVNDTLGHPAGDVLLIEVAERLRHNTREIDTVARFGGDEFSIILRQLKSADEMHSLAARLVSALSLPFRLGEHTASIGASIGIAIMDERRSDPEELMRNADVALYKAKSDGRGNFRVFEPALSAIIDHRRSMEAELRQGLSRGEFRVYYQPQLDSLTETVIGFEALVRWDSPVRGLVLPDDFIPLCEEIGLIDDLGEWVLKTACTDAMSWPDHIAISVNVSPAQFKSDRLVRSILCVLGETRISARRLELEITENVMFADSSRAVNLLRQLKQLGIRISLDDFGKGYSSLSYIRDFPFDRIKIDKSFVHALSDSNDSLAIIRAVASLCENLGITSTAEGVETQAQFDILNSERCASVQGYLFGKPMPIEDACRFVQNAPLRARA